MSELQILDSTTSLQAMTRVEIDTQIATAKQYPRDIKKALEQAVFTVTMSKEIAESCTYALPRRKKNESTGQYENVFITGPSKRLAEIMLQGWGNLSFGSRVIGRENNCIVAEGVCFDMQQNLKAVKQSQRRITDSKGNLYSEDGILLAGAAACAIALRNAIFEIIPRCYVEQVQAEARKFLETGLAGKLDKAIKSALDAFKKYKIEESHVLKMFGYKSISEITKDDYQNLLGIGVALREGQIKPESIINDEPIEGEDEGLSKADALNNRLKKNAANKGQK